MANSISYIDAVRLLEAKDARAINVLDKMAGATLLTSASIAFLKGDPAAGALAIGLIDAKTAAMQLGQSILSRIPLLSRDKNRHSRTEILTAAHAVIVMSSFFDVLRENTLRLPIQIKDIKLTKDEQVAIASDKRRIDQAESIARSFLEANIPVPSPQYPYEKTVELIHQFYEGASRRLSIFITGLHVWDTLDETQRENAREALAARLPNLAIRKYEEHYRKLAVDFPEFFVWASMQEHQATRELVARSGADLSERLKNLYETFSSNKSGLSGLEKILLKASSQDAAREVRQDLMRIYQADLKRPLAETSAVETHEGLHVPALELGYINPNFRITEISSLSRPAEDRWWETVGIRGSIQGFLAGYLTSLKATETPLVVLGQPGSGKSLLTRVLAARLPIDSFLPIRVELRRVQANAPLQDQIEEAIHKSTGDRSQWPDVSRGANGALPVVLLDGFDELLQSTKVNRSDYLEQVRDFQRREAELGRPVAVLVTSRTVVADRARIPHGSACLRLEPFTEEQITQWVSVWNSTNFDYFHRNHLSQLDPQGVLMNADLASQPLLLMMLALYDADENALRAQSEGMKQSELYERLLKRFTRRELAKTFDERNEELFSREIEMEMMRLSIVAYGMFNRNRQTISEDELDRDIAALLGFPQHHAPSSTHPGNSLTPAQLVVGRFFFIHESQATVDDTRLKIYEFLHATFGEYLVSRFTAYALQEYCTRADMSKHALMPSDSPNDGLLFALLSFSPLTMRGPVIEFLKELLSSRGSSREDLRRYTISAFQNSLFARSDGNLSSYSPVRLSTPSRHAIYSANLLLIIALLTQRAISGSELFGKNNSDAVNSWRSCVHLWKSQFTPEAWNGFVQSLSFFREWDEYDDRHFLVGMRTIETHSRKIDLHWSYNFPPRALAYGREGLMGEFEDVLQQPWLLADQNTDLVASVSTDLLNDYPELFSLISRAKDGSFTCSARNIVSLWLASCSGSLQEISSAYTRCIEDAGLLKSIPYVELLVRQLKLDSTRISSMRVAAALTAISQLSFVDEKILRSLEEIGVTKGRIEKQADLTRAISQIRNMISTRKRIRGA